MDNKIDCEEKCEFTVHPSNFKVKIKEIKPFHVRALSSILLNLRVISDYNIDSCLKIKSKPIYGNLYFLDSSTVIYKSTKRFTGYDLFQIDVEDECGEIRTENILIYVRCY